MTKILITGGCGFAGHHLVEHCLKETDYHIVVMDRLSYASHGFDRLRDIKAYDDRRVERITHDFTIPIVDGLAYELRDINYIVHLGAETHVDNSITDARPFVKSNVLGTLEVLEFARSLKNLARMIYFSTDEVFGPAPAGTNYKEWDNYNCTNPYSASKAGGEELCLAYNNTYKLPVLIIHCMNLFGERQHPEKFIPSTIRKVLNGSTVTIHSDPKRLRAGSRYYLHARNAADGVTFLLKYGGTRDKYNLVGQREVNNLELAQLIAQILDRKLEYEMVDFHSSRPGHDLRYALDGTRMWKLGWEAPVGFTESLVKTIQWYTKPENKKWLNWDLEG